MTQPIKLTQGDHVVTMASASQRDIALFAQGE